MTESPTFTATDLRKKFKSREMVMEQIRQEVVKKLGTADVEVPRLDPAVMSNLDALLWRDIEDLNKECYTEQMIRHKATERLREKVLFKSTVDKIVEQLCVENSQV